MTQLIMMETKRGNLIGILLAENVPRTHERVRITNHMCIPCGRITFNAEDGNLAIPVSCDIGNEYGVAIASFLP